MAPKNTNARSKCRGTIPNSISSWKVDASPMLSSIWSQYRSRFPYVVVVYNAATGTYSWLSTVSAGNSLGIITYMQPPRALTQFWQEAKCRGNQKCGKWVDLATVRSHPLKYRLNNSQTWTDSTFEAYFGSATSSVQFLDKLPTGKFDFYAGAVADCVKPSITTSFQTIYKLPKAISLTMPSNSTTGEFSLPSSFYGAPFTIDYEFCTATSCAPTTISIPSTNGLFATTGSGWNVTPVAGFNVPGVSVILTTDRKIIVSRTSTTIRNRVWKGIVSCSIPLIGHPNVPKYFKMFLEIVL